MRQLEHVDVADGDRLVELVAAHAVEQVDLAGVRQTRDFEQVADFRFARAVEYRRGEGNALAEAFGIFEELIVAQLRVHLPHRGIRKDFAEPAAQRFGFHFLAEQTLETIAKLLGGQPRCVSRICPTFIREGTPSGFRTISTGVPSGIYGMSSCGTMRAMTPLLPWRPAILSPMESLRFMAM